MNIICKYDREMEQFLSEVTEYTIKNYANELDLSNLQEIELLDKKTFLYETDGRSCAGGTKIIVTSRLYELLPSLAISDLLGNNDFQMLVNTLYHEMGHTHDRKKMPCLYDIADRAEKREEYLPCYLWLEYFAEKRSCMTGLVDNREFCEDFARSNWRANQFNLQEASEKNFFYLQKAVAYFMARTQNPKEREYYFENMKNDLLIPFISELDVEIKQLEAHELFDDVVQLNPLYLIIDKYQRKFKIRFSEFLL